ncbi:hypothetical protein CEXT_753151 [Caerostris extrusa]|uniref:Uncharacterized protein n=1 Tax=Caerostris extrusa TaxID=172846 RepID=A0AAV4W122_CAEEX|nr:hypothetical protein CEXT_753151 [Caerostris extrusa]
MLSEEFKTHLSWTMSNVGSTLADKPQAGKLRGTRRLHRRLRNYFKNKFGYHRIPDSVCNLIDLDKEEDSGCTKVKEID